MATMRVRTACCCTLQVQKLADRRLSIGGLRTPTESINSQESSSATGSKQRCGGRPDIGRASAPHGSWVAGHPLGGRTRNKAAAHTAAGDGGGGGVTAVAANRRASADVGVATGGWTTACAALGQQVHGATHCSLCHSEPFRDWAGQRMSRA
jgi:hypothetical protein